MIKVGDRIEVTAGRFARYKGTVTHFYEDTKRLTISFDTDSDGEGIDMISSVDMQVCEIIKKKKTGK